jgi:RimJ/RimL family protein N-acetyltransferase
MNTERPIKLRAFEAADIPRLIGWIPDARFLQQWAGPQYKHPLTEQQLEAAIKIGKRDKPPHLMFAALRRKEDDVIGHIELLAMDYEKKTAGLGRVLIGLAEHRRQGYGAAMIAEALDRGFDVLGMKEIWLTVFDFNRAAIACYQKLGFAPSEFRANARTFEKEKWNQVLMKLSTETWQKQRVELQKQAEEKNSKKSDS